MLNNMNNDKNMQLDPQIASQMLSNIFDACEIEQNSVPLEVLTSYSNYRKERFGFQKFVIIFVMILFFLLPILFIAPKFSLEQKSGEIFGKPYVELNVTSLVPIDKIEAFMSKEKVPVYEMADGTYQIIPTKNGTLDVTVHLINDQYTTRSIQVTDVDTKPPKLITSENSEGHLIVYFEENSSIIDYENVYAQNAAGDIIKPISYDIKNLSVTFNYPKENINIFVPDKSDNTLQVIVTLK